MIRSIFSGVGLGLTFSLYLATAKLTAWTGSRSDEAQCFKRCGAVCTTDTGQRTGCGVMNPCKVVACAIGWADSDPGDPGQICDESNSGKQGDWNDDCNDYILCNYEMEGCGGGGEWPPPI